MLCSSLNRQMWDSVYDHVTEWALDYCSSFKIKISISKKATSFYFDFQGGTDKGFKGAVKI